MVNRWPVKQFHRWFTSFFTNVVSKFEQEFHRWHGKKFSPFFHRFTGDKFPTLVTISDSYCTNEKYYFVWTYQGLLIILSEGTISFAQKCAEAEAPEVFCPLLMCFHGSRFDVTLSSICFHGDLSDILPLPLSKRHVDQGTSLTHLKWSVLWSTCLMESGSGRTSKRLPWTHISSRPGLTPAPFCCIRY